MKKMIIITVLCFYVSGEGFSQIVNWANLKKEDRHLVNINAGVDHGVVIGAGYGYHPGSRLPVILNAEFSFPGGENLFDDFKSGISGQVRFFKAGNFLFRAKLEGIFRRYENNFARLLNFGSDLSATAGYYRSKWFVATEAGFDKAIVTHFKHSARYKTIYPLAQDGWYESSTGGNFYYGVLAGYSIKQVDITIKAGKIITQDLQTKPLLPFYIQLGFSLKIRR